MENRVIFHVDMDAFFASIEILLNPSLKGKPVIVGGDPTKRGVVSTCSYEARAFGVHSAMSAIEAKQRCPHGIFIEGSYSQYGMFSEKVMTILRRLTHKVQVVSVDEAYLDVSDEVEKHGGPLALGTLLKQVIFKQTQLPCSIGIATSKLVAKIATSAAKPNGIKEILPGEEARFLAPLPIEAIPGIGDKTQVALNRQGIKLIGDLQDMGQDYLLQHYGHWGYQIYFTAIGQDHRDVEWGEYTPKSLGAETTFEKDQMDLAFLKEALQALVHKAWRHLDSNKMRTRAITIKLRDQNFKTITRSCLLFSDTNSFEILEREFLAFFKASYDGSFPLRLLGVSLHKLSDSYWQPTLWEW